MTPSVSGLLQESMNSAAESIHSSLPSMTGHVHLFPGLTLFRWGSSNFDGRLQQPGHAWLPGHARDLAGHCTATLRSLTWARRRKAGIRVWCWFGRKCAKSAGNAETGNSVTCTLVVYARHISVVCKGVFWLNSRLLFGYLFALNSRTGKTAQNNFKTQRIKKQTLLAFKRKFGFCLIMHACIIPVCTQLTDSLNLARASANWRANLLLISDRFQRLKVESFESSSWPLANQESESSVKIFS